MPVQANVNTTLAYKVESTLGTLPGNTGAKFLRRVSSSLNVNKDSFASNEVRSDQQVSDVRHGARSARGSIEGELSTATYDDFLEAALRGTWAANSTTSTAPADFATGITIANSGTGSTVTFAGAGSLITKGFKVGDIVRFTGTTNPLNSGINVRITTLTATVMTVFPQLIATGVQAAGWSVVAPGSRLNMGVTKRSFTIEQSHSDISVSERFVGCRIGGFAVNVPPNGIATASFDIMGLDGSILTGGSFPYFTSPTAAGNTGVVAGIDGALRLNGTEQAVVTALQLNYTNNLSMTPVIGSTISPDIFYGREVVTGTVSAYLENEALINVFLNETEVDLVAVVEASGANPQDFLAFNMQRIKFTGSSKTIGPDGGVIVQFPFQALLKTAGTGFDATTLTIQRSN